MFEIREYFPIASEEDHKIGYDKESRIWGFEK
jgi:hypothetical protein